ncbi:MAG: hypothetical protein HZA79_05780 [Sphingobacteriales bacterium]|nr:hypothetical protein [Sphingobacteriales bacterium]
MEKLLSLLIALALIGSACKKTKTESSSGGLPVSPETKPQYNNTSFGVYKGVVVGSTGTIVIRINNGDTIVKAYLSIGNNKDTLSANQPVIAGQPILDLDFTGRISSMTLSANADGSNAQVTSLTITGHPNAGALVVHENSTQQVLCYEGTFSGDLNGTICFVKVGTLIRSEPVNFLAKVPADTFFLKGNCVPETDTLRTHTHYMYDLGNPVRTFSGYPTFSNTNVTGPWVSYFPPTNTTFRGTINCTRTY